MRIVEKLLYGIGGLLALILFFILLCHFNPNITAKLGNSMAGQEQTTAVPDAATTADISALPTQTTSTSQSTPDVVNVAAQIPQDDGISTQLSGEGGYQAPDENSINVPGKVSGLNGLEVVEGKGTEITDHKAQELKQTLGKGNTGEGLTFDEVIYPYYQMLNDTGKALYRQIYANAQDLRKSFAPVETISPAQLRNAFMAVCNDHPELFWVNTAYGYQYAPDGSIAEIDLSFNITATQMDTAKAAFEAGAKEILDQTYGKYTDYDKEAAVHDAILDSVVYDKNAPVNQSAYSALVNGRTVCAGYARAFQYIMQQLGIPCYYVEGHAGENHAWNIVKLDDGYYNVDTTWDDTNPNTYDYFNCSDADYSKNHVRRELSVYLPPCNGTKYRNLEENTQPEQDNNTQDIVYVGYVTPTQTTTPSQSTTTTTTTTTQTTTPDTTTTGQTTTSDSTTTSGTTTQTRITAHAVSNAAGSTDTISALDDYYVDCLSHILDSNSNPVTFTNVVSDETLWKKIVKAYEKGDFEEGYAIRALVEKHMGSCTVDVTGTLQSDGTYKVTHTFTMR